MIQPQVSIYKHFTFVTYNCRNKLVHFESVYSMDGTPYFAAAVYYNCKMFMKLTTSVNPIRLLNSKR